jgi:RsiW-degrading membrane proteinase PrsW (M82 family)
MKLSLNIKSGTLAGRSFQLNQGFLTVGRSENCSVRFDPTGERVASKQHAFIEAKPDGFYLSDNNSTNGTFLNGQKIQSVRLNSGDIIEFGKNGVEASVFIESDANLSQPTVLKQDLQPIAYYQPAPTQQFNPVYSNQPVNLRNSFSGFGAARTAEKPKEDKTGKYLGIAVTIFAVVFLSLVVMLLMVSNLGFGTAVIASVIAFLPAMFYLLPLIWLDRYDPEPIWLLALAFAWGALVSIVFSYFINTEIAKVAAMNFGAREGMAISAVVSAPIFEEASKGLGLVLLLIFYRRYFDDILDGIVFAGTIALGFSTVENVLYYGSGLIVGGSEGLYATFFIRGILSPFAHVTFTAMTGIGCGISRESHNPFVRFLMPVLGYGCAVFLHFVWNLMGTLLQIEGVFEGNWYYGYFFLQVPFFLIFVCFAGYVMYRQNKIIKDMLAIDVARNLFPAEHLKKATSAYRSTFWLIEGIFAGKFTARNKYLRALGKLGLSYWHIQRANAAKGQTGSFQQNPILREEVLRWREKV